MYCEGLELFNGPMDAASLKEIPFAVSEKTF